MRRPRVPIPLAVQIAANVRHVLGLRADTVLAVLEHALLVGVEALPGQFAFDVVVQVGRHVATIEETHRLTGSGFRKGKVSWFYCV